MGAQTVITPSRLAIRPGSEASAQLTVTNTGRVVDSFLLEVLGPAGAWSACEPATVSLLPGQSAVAQVLFRPPVAADVPAGPLSFGVHARSSEDPMGSVVAEGVLDVEAVPLVSAELSPRTGRARGHRRSKHQVAVDNRGNAPVLVGLVGYDDQDAVDVTVDPPQVEVGAGSAAFVTVRARGVHRFWRGPAQTRPFTVEAQPQGSEPIRMQAGLLHEAAVPGWLGKALMVATAVAAACALFWFGLFKPTIKDTATNAAEHAANAAVSSANAKPGGSGGGSGSGSGGGGGGSGSTPSPTPTPPPSPTPTPSRPSTAGHPQPPKAVPAPFALQLNSATPALVAAPTKQISVTDLLMQNPAADKGLLTITRDGKALFTIRLEDIRDYDQHLVTPIVVPAGKTLAMQVSCANGAGKPACTPAVFVSGLSTDVAP